METLTRRLPVFLLLDCSESMVGDALDAVNQGLRDLIDRLGSDPQAIETVYLSVIAFGGRARQLAPLTEVMNFRPPKLIPEPGTHLGAGLKLLGECIRTQVNRGSKTVKGDYKPMVFLLTDGQPTDDWRSGLRDFQSSAPGVNVIAVGLGEDADIDVLKAITPTTLQMKKCDPDQLAGFFKWVSASVSTVSHAFERAEAPTRTPDLPEGVGLATGGGPGKEPAQYILMANCQKTKQPYLMRYRRSGSSYDAEKGYAVSADYAALAGTAPAGKDIDAGKLRGAPACPYCGNVGWRTAATRVGLECNDKLEISGGGGGKAQVYFVLDITGSMGGEIEGVKNTIGEFVESVRKEGLSVEVGLVAFRDLEQREPSEVLKFSGKPFTGDPAAFKREVSRLHANGGGGNPGESAYDGIAQACRQPWGEGGRILILITDEPPLLPDGEIRSMADLSRVIKGAKIDQIHLVVPDYLKAVYAPLHGFAPGEFFSMKARGGEAFRKVLLNVGKSITITTRIG